MLVGGASLPPVASGLASDREAVEIDDADANVKVALLYGVVVGKITGVVESTVFV